MWSLVCSVQSKIAEWKKLWNTKMKWFNSNTQLHSTATLIRRLEVKRRRKKRTTTYIYVQIETTTIVITTKTKYTFMTFFYVSIDEIRFTYICNVRMYIRMCVCLYAKWWCLIVYAVIIVDTLYKKDIFTVECLRFCCCFFCTWPMNFHIWRLYNKISLSLIGFGFGLVWLDLVWLIVCQNTLFFTVFRCHLLFFFTDVKTMFFFRFVKYDRQQRICCTSGCLSLSSFEWNYCLFYSLVIFPIYFWFSEWTILTWIMLLYYERTLKNFTIETYQTKKYETK